MALWTGTAVGTRIRNASQGENFLPGREFMSISLTEDIRTVADLRDEPVKS